MTIDEAIKIINQYDVNFYWYEGAPISDDKLMDAFDMAISALKAQSGKDINVRGKDTVYRQAAIDAVDEKIKFCDRALASFQATQVDKYTFKIEKASLNTLKETLEYLPSAEPDIIRCKDCKYWGKRGLCEKWNHYISNEVFYCGCAKRRTNE